MEILSQPPGAVVRLRSSEARLQLGLGFGHVGEGRPELLRDFQLSRAPKHIGIVAGELAVLVLQVSGRHLVQKARHLCLYPDPSSITIQRSTYLPVCGRL